MADRKLFAHSRSSAGVRHSLEDHLRGSAALAGRFGEVFGCGELAAYLALIHDVGKGTCAWQDRLVAVECEGGGRVGVGHKHAGTFLADKYTKLPFGAVVFGHHGGMPDMEQLKDELVRAMAGGDEAQRVAEAIRAVEAVVPEIHPDPRPALPTWLGAPSGQGRLGLDLLVRMLFSCVVDADFLDTAAHFGCAGVRLRESVDMTALVERYEVRRAKLLAGREPSPVDALRQRVYEQACVAASGKPGVYVLHVPTGGAKTMAAGAFALRHAAANGMGRVILAVPFISITEQNAAVYRRLLDPDSSSPEEAVVLEHHSAVDLDSEERLKGLTDEQREELQSRAHTARLAAENWDAPFVVTTTVRLFESLFSHKPSQMRRLHRLAGSVIVLDEVQALPDRLLIPILSVLRGLVDHFGVTVVLASATQPSFWRLPAWEGLERRNIVDDPSGLFEALRRVDYAWRTGDDVSLESIAAEVAAYEQVLTVVNTTKDAARFHRHLDEHVAHGAEVLHLSTRMTAGHRREVIAEIKELLGNGQPVQVVSTSLIEAGVDLDFPRVYRAWAPAESLQQAAGRCNRDGRLHRGTVVIFQPSDGKQPRSTSYEAALNASGAHFGPGRSAPDDLEALERYYPLRYTLQQGTPDSGLGAEIEYLRHLLNFPEVDRSFQMIEDALSAPVVVIRQEADREAIESAIAQLRDFEHPCGPEVLRSLQPHTASLPRGEAEAALRSGLATPITGDLLLWEGGYHPQRGLDPDAPEDRSAFNY
ncbi:CRISPR-associated helicase/endonuclease Cas3 [Streptomyces sp. CT34]|uniref:CRISPR-associated helicase/endonuclease Cas3 n=1 Tax=Streptomyces sp. CT34 TaxID=1553907 RepID=UPI0005BBD166|nr:CRISPR-associated helicase/endonuclease Cas3 [Streptomyces sp. CT34]